MQSKLMQEACEKLKQDMLKSLNGTKVTSIEVGITDPQVATYATYVERGWVQRVTPAQSLYFLNQGISPPPKAGSSLVNPPRPFFSGTIAARSADWKRLLERFVKANGYKSLIQGLELVALEAQSDIKDTVASGRVRGGEAFEERSDLTMALYAQETKGKKTDGTGSLSNRQPLNKTGTLFNSISWRFKER